MKIGDSELHQAIDHLEAGDWRSAHAIVQQDEGSPLACWAHGIVHLIEGNESNARYWYHAAHRPFRGQGSVAEEINALKSAADT